jgi:hypothetical protein
MVRFREIPMQASPQIPADVFTPITVARPGKRYVPKPLKHFGQ